MCVHALCRVLGLFVLGVFIVLWVCVVFCAHAYLFLGGSVLLREVRGSQREVAKGGGREAWQRGRKGQKKLLVYALFSRIFSSIRLAPEF